LILRNEKLLGKTSVNPRRRGADDGGDTGSESLQDAFATAFSKSGSSRTKDESGNTIAMATPKQLCDWPTHRIPNRDGAFNPEDIEEGGSVIGAIVESELAGIPDAVSVTTMIEGNDSEVTSEWLVRGKPVERRVGRPAVQKQESGSARRPGEFTHECCATSGQFEKAPFGQSGCREGRLRNGHGVRRMVSVAMGSVVRTRCLRSRL
jgi:hypothetical protein